MISRTSIFLAILLAGCTTSTVLVGTTRPPISTAQVKIYLSPPPKFEEIALVSASGDWALAFTDQSQMNAVMADLKAAAAKLGANGVLLKETGDKQVGSIGGMTFGSAAPVGMLGTSTITAKKGTGVAIFVPDEK